MITLKVNGQSHQLNAEPTMPLLWALRELLGLTGTKFGCGVSMCGACTVHVNGEPTRACVTKLSSCANKDITTIEGLAQGPTLHAVQQAWLDEQVPQCGYCQSGQIMLACGLLKQTPNPSDQDINDYMSDNLCRCGTYTQIRAAIKRAVAAGGSGGGT